MSRQLTFDLPGLETFGRDDFFPSPANAAALGLVDCWRLWPGGMLLLVGPEGSGKTHLAHIFADDADAAVVAARSLAVRDLPDLIRGGALVVEGADRIAGDGPGETALFHLYNMAKAAGIAMLLTARTPPRDWGLTLPDLASRMQSVALTRLDPPDDALLSAVMAKLFADRQVVVSPGLISFVVARMDRSIDAARQIVAELDRRALARKGPILRQDAADILSAALPMDTATFE